VSSGKGYYISPIVIFLTAITLFELCVRLPYVLYVRFSTVSGYKSFQHFFAGFDPDLVIFVGTFLLLMTALMCVSIALKIGMFYKVRSLQIPELKFPKIFYLIAIIFIGAAFTSVLLLGVSNLTDNLSGKRSEAGESLLIYVTVKMANFCHLIAIIFFVKNLQKRSLIDRVFFLLATVALILGRESGESRVVPLFLRHHKIGNCHTLGYGNPMAGTSILELFG